MLDSLKGRLETLRNHPVGRRQPILTLLRFLKAEIINSWLGHSFLVSHEFGVFLIVEKHYHATRSHYFFGLQEFEDELFAINLLRENELFVDIGANVGMFSIMVTATTGARVIAIEPSPSSSRAFKRHILLNDLMDRITLIEACAGNANDKAFIMNTVAMENFIVLEGDNLAPGMVKVPMIRIDDVVDGTIPCVMKMDIEGFELQALKGAMHLLGCDTLQAITVEIAHLSNRFGVSPDETHNFIAGFGFAAVRYDPLTRMLTPLDRRSVTNRDPFSNTIYVRNLDWARARLSAAPRRHLRKFTI